MQTFTSTREAKEFLIACIVEEAQREEVPLSELERKMLYFSETAWSLPDIYEVNEAFEREYDSAEYEEKVGNLIRNFCKAMREADPHRSALWKEAVHVLKEEDHYLQVLIGISSGSIATQRETSDSPQTAWRLKYIIIGLVVFLALLVILMIYAALKR